jgi:hypothetical protein
VSARRLPEGQGGTWIPDILECSERFSSTLRSVAFKPDKGDKAMKHAITRIVMVLAIALVLGSAGCINPDDSEYVKQQKQQQQTDILEKIFELLD